MPKKTLMSWSSGKDSAWALHRLQQDPEIELLGIFTTVNRQFERVAMHAVRLELLQMQADALGLPLHVIDLPWPCSNEEYQAAMAAFVAQALADGTECFGFGDLFLEDVRDYRVSQLTGTGIEPLFPLWGESTEGLLDEMIDGGLRAVTTCIDPKQTPRSLLGQVIDEEFKRSLPAGLDPCGENGEFHTFVFDGPMYTRPIAIEVGEQVERDGFWFADVLPAAPN